MKTSLIVFTGTGNTLSVARDLAAALAGETEIIRLSHRSFPEEIQADRVVILYPVYSFGLPAMVLGWLGLVRFTGNPPVYGIATYGGLAGAAGHLFRKRIKSRGFRFSGHFGVHMPSNFITLSDIVLPKVQERIFAKEVEQVKKIAAVIEAGKKSGVAKSLGLLGRLFTAVGYPPFAKHVHHFAKGYTVSKACTGCGICTEVCPAGNIWMEDNRPVFGERCEACYSCIHLCPVACIQSGKSTVNKKRYRHPSIPLKDLKVYTKK